jgi:hypothetical protein
MTLPEAKSLAMGASILKKGAYGSGKSCRWLGDLRLQGTVWRATVETEDGRKLRSAICVLKGGR